MNQKLRSLLRNPLLYSSCMFLLAALYVGWIFFSRWQENRAMERRMEEKKAEQKRAEDERSIETLGGNRFEIQSFYAMPGIIRRGGAAQLCYGVSNAKTVRLDPPAGEVWPSYSRCIEVSPKKDTTYTLTAEDAGGHTKTASLTLKVQ